jgi:hypothetical protein
MEWTSELINIYFFPRNAIPADITSGNPDPSGWGLPTANFESQYGNCDIDANFPAQTIVSICIRCRLNPRDCESDKSSTLIQISAEQRQVDKHGQTGQIALAKRDTQHARHTLRACQARLTMRTGSSTL